MFKSKKILALILARSGSKGLPGKNIRILSGKPLIAWTIDSAKKSKYIDEIIVSTDSKKIADVAKQYGAQIPFMRPARLATDKAKSIDVVLHVIRWLERNLQVYDVIVLLQPTTPLRGREDIDGAIELLFSKKAKGVASVMECSQSPIWASSLPKNGCMKNFVESKYANKNRQELPVFYCLNGAVFVAYLDYIKEQKNFIGNKTFAYIMPRERSVDIDDEMDFIIAEALVKKKLAKVSK